MPVVEERVAYIEGRIRSYPQMFSMLRNDTGDVKSEVMQVRNELRDDIGQLRSEMHQGFARMDDRMSRQFMWTVGIQVTTLLAVVGALLSRT